jgi:hypothetical protein
MNDTEVATFLQAAHARLDLAKWNAEIDVDDARWVVGFVQGAPYRMTPLGGR